MRIAILGGTRFVGRAVVEQLAAEGHALLVVHRGDHEPDGLVEVEHAHVDRHDGTALAAALKPFDPEALVDISGMNAAAADAALGAVGPSVKLVAISSCDVYRAYDGVHSNRTTDALPLTEESPLRERRFVDGPQYENLEIEERYPAAWGDRAAVGRGLRRARLPAAVRVRVAARAGRAEADPGRVGAVLVQPGVRRGRGGCGVVGARR
jgi:hypothetical protein